MTFNINTFRASPLDGEPARSAFYDVRITGAPKVAWDRYSSNDGSILQKASEKVIDAVNDNVGGSSDSVFKMSLRCDEAELPGRLLASTEHKYYGPMQKHVYGSIYEDVELQFICSESMSEKEFFDAWVTFIYNDNEARPNPGFETARGPRYKKDYEGQIEITQYDRDNQARYKVILQEAYPINIQPLSLSWGAQNEIHRLRVTIAYTRWTSRKIGLDNSIEAIAQRTIL